MVRLGWCRSMMPFGACLFFCVEYCLLLIAKLFMHRILFLVQCIKLFVHNNFCFWSAKYCYNNILVVAAVSNMVGAPRERGLNDVDDHPLGKKCLSHKGKIRS